MDSNARHRSRERCSPPAHILESHVRAACPSVLDPNRLGVYRGFHLVRHPHLASIFKQAGIVHRAPLGAAHGRIRILYGFGSTAPAPAAGSSRVQSLGRPCLGVIPDLAYRGALALLPPSARPALAPDHPFNQDHSASGPADVQPGGCRSELQRRRPLAEDIELRRREVGEVGGVMRSSRRPSRIFSLLFPPAFVYCLSNEPISTSSC